MAAQAAQMAMQAQIELSRGKNGNEHSPAAAVDTAIAAYADQEPRPESTFSLFA